MIKAGGYYFNPNWVLYVRSYPRNGVALADIAYAWPGATFHSTVTVERQDADELVEDLERLRGHWPDEGVEPGPDYGPGPDA